MVTKVRPLTEKVVPSGAMRQRFLVENRASTATASGERANTWTEAFRIRGNLRNGRQRVSEVGAQLNTEDTMLLRTRYRTGFKSGGQQRVTDEETSKVYRVDTWLDVSARRRWIDLVVVEVGLGEIT